MHASTGSTNFFGDGLHGGTNLRTVAVDRGQHLGRHPPEALQVEKTPGFAASESSAGHIGLPRHGDPHPRGAQSVKELESRKRQVVSVIHRDVHEFGKGGGNTLAHNTLGTTNNFRSRISPGSRTGQHGAKLLPKI